MRLSATKLRTNIYRVLDKVLKTGVPVEIERKGKVLKIVPIKPEDKLKNITPHSDYLMGNPDLIVHMDWSMNWRP